MTLSSLDKATLAILAVGILSVGVSAIFLDNLFPVSREFSDDLPLHPGLAHSFVGTNPGAPITLVEFGDYQCPNTKDEQPVISRLLSEFGSDINFVHKDFPLNIHTDSRIAAQAAVCVAHLAPDKHSAFSDLLFSNQARLKREDLAGYAKQLGILTPAFDSCLDDPAIAKQVQHDLDTAILEGVRGTPTLFINGKPFEGFQSYSKLKIIIESLLEVSRGKNN